MYIHYYTRKRPFLWLPEFAHPVEYDRVFANISIIVLHGMIYRSRLVTWGGIFCLQCWLPIYFVVKVSGEGLNWEVYPMLLYLRFLRRLARLAFAQTRENLPIAS